VLRPRTSSVKFFSGLVHAPEREDLLVLRKVSPFAKIAEENSKFFGIDVGFKVCET